MKRIKDARQLRGISQIKLAEKLNVTQQAISYYENGSRTPDDETLEKLSLILQVPSEYLTGETDDPDGWDLWEKATGYNAEQISKEISRMKTSHHVVGDSENLQNLIAQAVRNLDGHGNTDRGILYDIAYKITELQSDLQKRYEDPRKLNQLPGEGTVRIRPANLKSEEIIYEDLSPSAYEKAIDVLIEARRDLQRISNELYLD